MTVTSNDVGGSGINVASYKYSKDNGVTWTTSTSATSYTFTGLLTGTYQCIAKVLDNAGNFAVSNVVSISTKELGTVTMSANPTGWTNSAVTVTITYPVEVITKQYSTNGTTWNTYTSALTINTNNTVVYAKGLDAAGNQTLQATLSVTNIDKAAPVITLNGGNQVNVDQDGTYTEQGAIATDDADSNIQSKIIITGTVNTAVAGTYLLTYDVTDAAGNSATPITRIVYVNEPYIAYTKTFNYTGSQSVWLVPNTGKYKLELWGAEGGIMTSNTGYPLYSGGDGGYASGEITLGANESIYIYVGGAPSNQAYSSRTGGFNGGGNGDGGGNYGYGGGGGGATDIRRNGTALSNRIIVAGGGGGAGRYYNGGTGGGLTGGNGTSDTPSKNPTGGTQTQGGNWRGTLGIGASGVPGNGPACAGGGGGGYYGGGSNWTQSTNWNDLSSGGGGSSYIGGVNNGTTTSGVNVGNGKIVITRIP